MKEFLQKYILARIAHEGDPSGKDQLVDWLADGQWLYHELYERNII